MSKLANAAADVRRVRRDLSPDEVTWLASATLASGEAFRGLTGADRHCSTSPRPARDSEFPNSAALQRRDFALAGDSPTVTAKAAYTKNGQSAVQPLAADLAGELASYLAAKANGKPVWHGTWKERSAAMLRRDLAGAAPRG